MKSIFLLIFGEPEINISIDFRPQKSIEILIFGEPEINISIDFRPQKSIEILISNIDFWPRLQTIDPFQYFSLAIDFFQSRMLRVVSVAKPSIGSAWRSIG
jgi:hypothetical protein